MILDDCNAVLAHKLKIAIHTSGLIAALTQGERFKTDSELCSCRASYHQGSALAEAEQLSGCIVSSVSATHDLAPCSIPGHMLDGC